MLSEQPSGRTCRSQVILAKTCLRSDELDFRRQYIGQTRQIQTMILSDDNSLADPLRQAIQGIVGDIKAEKRKPLDTD
jgi:hypothetical protein